LVLALVVAVAVGTHAIQITVGRHRSHPFRKVQTLVRDECTSDGTSRCTGEMTYSTCESGVWVSASCSDGYTCVTQDNSARCNTLGGSGGLGTLLIKSDPCDADGTSRCTGDSTYSSCEGGVWVSASCSDGYTCVTQDNEARCNTVGGSGGLGTLLVKSDKCDIDGSSMCTGEMTYSTCDSGVWVSATCSDGYTCVTQDDSARCNTLGGSGGLGTVLAKSDKCDVDGSSMCTVR